MYEERLLWPAYPSNFSLCEINMATQSQKRWKSMFVTNTSPQSGESVDFESKKAFPSKENGWRLLFSEDQREKFTAPSYVSDFNFFVDQLQLQEMCEGSPKKIHLLCIIQNFQKLKSMIYRKYLHDLKMWLLFSWYVFCTSLEVYFSAVVRWLYQIWSSHPSKSDHQKSKYDPAECPLSL